MNIPGRPPGAPSPAEPFVPDLSEGAEAGVYLALLELIDEGLIITGDEFILDANSAACHLLGRDYRQVAGRSLSALFPTEEAFLDVRARLLIQGERRSLITVALPEGGTRELQVLCAPRLRPGLHALILSPAGTHPQRLGQLAADPTSQHFASHIESSQLRSALPGTRMLEGTAWQSGLDAFETGLRSALDNGNLTLHFQPLVETRSGRLCAGEALLRWQHPELGLIPFGRFKGALRDPQLIARLGDWVLNTACRYGRLWPAGPAGRQPPRLTVNVATEQLLHGDFAECVRLILENSNLAPDRLELDLDERILETDSPSLLQTMTTLSAMGVRLAIDDFGRGMSSIRRLKRYPLKAVKLDPDLVRGVGRDEECEAVVEAMAGMAATLGLEVFARGVETRAQQDFLCALDCHLQQGPLFGPPLDAQAFVRSLRAAIQ